MDISQCVNCGTNVIPTNERLCPSCGRSIDDQVVGGSASTGSNNQANPYHPVSLAPPSAGELDLLIAKREGGIRTSLWFMLVAGVAVAGFVMKSIPLLFVALAGFGILAALFDVEGRVARGAIKPRGLVHQAGDAVKANKRAVKWIEFIRRHVHVLR